MPRARQVVAQKVADRLFAVEEALDLALTRAAELAASMPEARHEARLSAIVGQDAMEHAVAAMAALAEARRKIVDTHQSLDRTREEIGLQEVDAGDLVPKPARFFEEARMPQIRVVA